MREVTKWFKFNASTKFYDYNHLEDGHACTDSPAAFSPAQVKIFGEPTNWRKQLGYLNDDNQYVPMITT